MQVLQLSPKKVLLQQVFSESEGGVKKLVSVLVTSTPVTGTREKTVETIEAVEIAWAGKYPENLV